MGLSNGHGLHPLCVQRALIHGTQRAYQYYLALFFFQIGLAGVYYNNTVQLPSNTKIFLLYTTNFSSGTNTSYKPEFCTPIDTTVGTDFYMKDTVGAVNSCPSYLENETIQNQITVQTQGNLPINSASLDVRFLCVNQ